MRQVTLCFVLGSILNIQNLSSQNPSLSISESYGAYQIGFKTFTTFDKSRSFSFEENQTAVVEGKTISRPLQVCIWYPSKNNTMPTLTYEDYFFLKASETGEKVLDEVKKNEVISNFLETEPTNKAILSREMAVSMKAVKNAPYQDSKKFPVIIYGPSWWASAFENALLFEFLASHGYMVISSPSVGPENREMPISRIGVETQSRDMEFLLSLAHDIPSADINSIAVAGFSLGGLSNVLMMARNTSVDAWIGLDPSIHEIYDFFKDSPYEDYGRFVKPMLFINSLGFMDSLPFYDKLIYSDAFMVNLPKLEHTDLASQFIKLFGSMDTKENLAIKVSGYNLMVKYVLAFLNGIFRDALTYEEMTEKYFTPNTKDATFLRIRSKRGLPLANTLFVQYQEKKGEGLIDFLNKTKLPNGTPHYPEADVQKLIFLAAKNEFFKTSKDLMTWYHTNYQNTFHDSVLNHINPNQMLEMFLKIYDDNKACDFGYDQLNHTAQLLSMGGKGKESLQYFVLNTQLHPENYKAYFNLGIGYFRLNDFKNAILNFTKCLDLKPDAKYKNLANEFILKSKG
ncbi:hypothetical protein L0P88_05940 [Muricauda sp. SCSIO 64092]|uniref:hypothetical protein n=1 Tax=Allomuricauda sp. SCSIO 64092 TaxID=2908842 RepID=UPI001FF2F7F3|nr:hypothetical protein [Muricauda sp. SCSIO 64092]UOY08094.1 hypothetical protein L0P88_05940 [Muricauda sp. SCSIO 64092]